MELTEYQKTVFIRAFARCMEEGYGELDSVCLGAALADDADEGDAEIVRCALSDCIGEAAYIAGLDADSAEAEGMLGDLVCEEYPALNEYLCATTDTHLSEGEAQP